MQRSERHDHCLAPLLKFCDASWRMGVRSGWVDGSRNSVWAGRLGTKGGGGGRPAVRWSAGVEAAEFFKSRINDLRQVAKSSHKETSNSTEIARAREDGPTIVKNVVSLLPPLINSGEVQDLLVSQPPKGIWSADRVFNDFLWHQRLSSFQDFG